MKLKFAFWLAGIAAILLAFDVVLGLLLWSNMNEQERETVSRILLDHAGVIVLLGLFALTGLGFLLKIVFKAYVLTPKWISDETRIILSANPAHRIQPAGPAEIRELCQTINSLADQYQSHRLDVESRIAEAAVSLQDEKNRLAALMSQLNLSVIVCNVEGRIILYNNAAKQLLGRTQWIGLGRSVFGVLDRSLIAHGLDDIRHRLAEGDAQPVAHMITTTAAGQLVRAQMAPVPGREDEIGGFVLTLDDVTGSVETSNRRDLLLQAITESTRAALGNIRAAVENMLAYPDMKVERRSQFTRIIGDEARRLSQQLDQTLAQFSDYIKTRLPIESMRGEDLLSVIARRINQSSGLRASTNMSEPDVWLKVDSYSVTLAACYLARQLNAERGADVIDLSLVRAGRLAHFDFSFAGPPLDSDVVRKWEDGVLREDSGAPALKLKQVLERHDAEILHGSSRQGSFLRLLLPTADAPKPVERGHESRPEYYDFDLFNQPGQTAELDEQRLSELTYTVFDTETTGLSPSEGDEIISIGAVRVVNGRILQHEAFDQLIDPKRIVPKKSVAVHGITSDMLRGQPSIVEVLPKFFKFCEDTVLVAHNAAFDMRFLQLKEEATGVRFTQPVLDTLLLSPVVHPFDPEHRLEAMAKRLGVDVTGRHTALGDAFVTAEVFLKMIPVLAEKGIYTLREAREASQQSMYAKVTY
jgi:DNA polymerase-3 subunit epsilon